MKRYDSWGRFPRVTNQTVERLLWRGDAPRLDRFDRPVLPYAWGRSYGDSCLNEGGILLDTTSLDRFIAFDAEGGLLRCEAGVRLDQILELIVPRGWFLPVTPGTKFVSVGGAIANDIHGKNHHKEGTFGRHVTRFELLRSDGQRLLCSPTENAELFRATIGGLGLTGLMLWAEFRLKPIQSASIQMERVKFRNLEEFFEISARSDQGYEYTVTWLDTMAQGRSLGRGVLMRGNHAAEGYGLEVRDGLRVAVPFDFPALALNPLTIKAFNLAYYHYQLPRAVEKVVHYNPFFYPLDAVKQWNRIYGKRGFLQYQFVLPEGSDPGHRIIRKIIARIARSGEGFLNVFKEFGDAPSPGMLSFPRAGITLALDFPFNGPRTLALLTELDELVHGAGGVIYPAKDGRMAASDFQRAYPQWREFAQYVDPHFSSSFWRRVTADAAPVSPQRATPVTV